MAYVFVFALGVFVGIAFGGKSDRSVYDEELRVKFKKRPPPQFAKTEVVMCNCGRKSLVKSVWMAEHEIKSCGCCGRYSDGWCA